MNQYILNIKNVLPCINICLYIDDEWNTLPHAILTSDNEWNPIILGCNIDDGDIDNDDCYYAIYDASIKHNYILCDYTGGYKYRHDIHGIDN